MVWDRVATEARSSSDWLGLGKLSALIGRDSTSCLLREAIYEAGLWRLQSPSSHQPLALWYM